jgi:hypothetical protein
VQVPKEPRVLSFSFRADPPETIPIDARPEVSPSASAPDAGSADAGASDGGVASTGQGAADVVLDDERVYDAMLLRAFDEGVGRLLAVFFEPKIAAERAGRRP